jgi:DNA-binding protein YbaB
VFGPGSGAPFDPEQWVRDMDERMSALRGRAESAKQDLEDNNVTLTSNDRAVTVTVNGSGSLLSLQYGSRAEGMSTQMLATKTMQTYQKACAEAAQRTTAIMSGLLGADSDAMDILKAAMPPPPEADEDDSGGGRRSP